MATHFHKDVTEEYSLGSVIGRGSFATVFRAQKKNTNEEVAIKQLNKLRLLWGSFRNPQSKSSSEVDMLRNLHHPNIIRLHSIYETNKTINLVLELGQGGSLLSKLEEKGPYSEENAKSVIRSVLNAVRYLHAQNLVHRDLKSDNIVLMSPSSDTDVKLTDFGFSKLSNFGLTSFVGTAEFLAPEMLKGKGYGKEVDIWAVGIVTYQILSNELPFKAGSTADLYSLIQKSDVPFPDSKWKHISSNAKDFIKQMLHPDPKKRLTATQACAHEWLSVSRNSSFEDRDVRMLVSLASNPLSHSSCDSIL